MRGNGPRGEQKSKWTADHGILPDLNGTLSSVQGEPGTIVAGRHHDISGTLDRYILRIAVHVRIRLGSV